jgi:hypothetical protein
MVLNRLGDKKGTSLSNVVRFNEAMKTAWNSLPGVESLGKDYLALLIYILVYAWAVGVIKWYYLRANVLEVRVSYPEVHLRTGRGYSKPAVFNLGSVPLGVHKIKKLMMIFNLGVRNYQKVENCCSRLHQLTRVGMEVSMVETNQPHYFLGWYHSWLSTVHVGRVNFDQVANQVVIETK